MIRLGLIGYGYWGPRIARNFHGVSGCILAKVCDKRSDLLQRVKQEYSQVEVTSDPNDILTGRATH